MQRRYHTDNCTHVARRTGSAPPKRSPGQLCPDLGANGSYARHGKPKLLPTCMTGLNRRDCGRQHSFATPLPFQSGSALALLCRPRKLTCSALARCPRTCFSSTRPVCSQAIFDVEGTLVDSAQNLRSLKAFEVAGIDAPYAGTDNRLAVFLPPKCIDRGCGPASSRQDRFMRRR